MSNGALDTKYRKIFRDIVRGYSKNQDNSLDQIFYVKHLTTHDQVDLEDIEDLFYRKAQKKGLPTEKDRINYLIEEGGWSKEDDNFIETQNAFISNLLKSKNQLILKSQIDKQQGLIDKETIKLNEKLEEREALLGNTCEKYSKQRVNDYYISKSFFKDENLKEKCYSEEQFNDVSYTELRKLVKIHNSQFTLFSEDNIQRLILEDFYFPYMPFCEDTVQFFGKPVCELTHNQLKLILFTRIFKGIFDQNDDIPEKIRKDPKALMDFASSSKKGKEELDKHSDKGGAGTIVGATKEDYEYMGVDPNSVKGSETLSSAAEKKGGSLNMNDLMELAGE